MIGTKCTKSVHDVVCHPIVSFSLPLQQVHVGGQWACSSCVCPQFMPCTSVNTIKNKNAYSTAHLRHLASHHPSNYAVRLTAPSKRSLRSSYT